MLDLQILALMLIPIFSANVPSGNGGPSPALSVLGIDRPVTVEFMVGTWRTSEEFFRLGDADREKATIRPFKGSSYMSLRRDGTMKMVNFFQPSEGSWELGKRGLIINDPMHPEFGSRIFTVRKRDDDRIWVLFPFAGASAGIGMVRVPDEEMARAKSKPEPPPLDLPAYRQSPRPHAAGPRERTLEDSLREAEALIPAAVTAPSD